MIEAAAALGLHSLGLFSLTVLVLNATPGVDMLFTVSRTLTGGVRSGLAAAAGICAGCVVHALLAAFGLAALLAVSSWTFAALKWAGAAYLAWMALGMLRAAARPGEPGAAARGTTTSAWAVFRQGLLTNVLNPKVALFFLAFLPQFVPAGAWSATASFLLLGAWFVVQGLLFLLVLVAVSARLRRLQARPAVARGLQALGGLLFVALALRLLRERPVGV